MRAALEELGIGYGAGRSAPGRFYDYPGDPLAAGVCTEVSHRVPASGLLMDDLGRRLQERG